MKSTNYKKSWTKPSLQVLKFNETKKTLTTLEEDVFNTGTKGS